MRHKALALGLAATTFLFAQFASAAGPDEFGRQGTAALFGERLFGIHFSRVKQELGNGDTATIETTGISLGWRGRGSLTPFEVPRVAFDYFVIDSLSVGGALGYASYGDDFDYEEFLLAPRVGYAFMFSDVIGLWLRGGFTYHSLDPDPGGSESGMAFTAEAMFIVAPTPHFGIIFGPTFDIDFTGEDDDDRDRRYRSFSLLNAGIGGWF